MIGDIESFVSFKVLQEPPIERSLEHNVLCHGKVGLEFQFIFEESDISPEAGKLLR